MQMKVAARQKFRLLNLLRERKTEREAAAYPVPGRPLSDKFVT